MRIFLSTARKMRLTLLQYQYLKSPATPDNHYRNDASGKGIVYNLLHILESLDFEPLYGTELKERV